MKRLCLHPLPSRRRCEELVSGSVSHTASVCRGSGVDNEHTQSRGSTLKQIISHRHYTVRVVPSVSVTWERSGANYSETSRDILRMENHMTQNCYRLIYMLFIVYVKIPSTQTSAAPSWGNQGSSRWRHLWGTPGPLYGWHLDGAERWAGPESHAALHSIKDSSYIWMSTLN